MGEKRYQIFVSSTFNDLQEERQKIFSAIMKLNHIPAGMEFFAAIDEDQMKFICRVIDESDYYVLLLGARYGSLDATGISYTEREFDYAVKKGLKVIALIHAKPDNIERGKTDKDESLFEKFMSFRTKVMDGGRLVALWSNQEDLIQQFYASLIQTIQRYPSLGWIRGDFLASTETLQRVAALEVENQRLKEYAKNFNGMNIATDIKMEACSVTNPTVFSETEIECISLDIKWPDISIPPSALFSPENNHYSKEEIKDYYFQKAIPWFINMARICRFDLKLTNPNFFSIKELGAEQHFFDENRNELNSFEIEEIEPSPSRLDLGLYSPMTSQHRPPENLNPHQSAMYTHYRYFLPRNDMDIIYQRIISGENIPEPIKKEIKVHARIKTIVLEIEDLIKIIQNLESQKMFNDAGVFRYVSSVISKSKD